MNCRKVCSLLSSYLDGELAGVEQIQIREHLRNCSCCNEEHDSLQQTKRLLATLAVRSPRHGFDDTILRRIETDGNRRPRLDPVTWWALLGEPQRARLRMLTVSGMLLVAVALWVRIPLTAARPGAALARLERIPPVEMDQTAAPAGVGAFVRVHNSGEEALPLSSGMGLVPVSSSAPANLVSVHP